MHFEEDDLEELVAIWKQEFQEDITHGEASVHAVRLIELYRTLEKSLSC